MDPEKGPSGSDDAYIEGTLVETDQKLNGAPPDTVEETIDKAADASVPNSQRILGSQLAMLLQFPNQAGTPCERPDTLRIDTCTLH